MKEITRIDRQIEELLRLKQIEIDKTKLKKVKGSCDSVVSFYNEDDCDDPICVDLDKRESEIVRRFLFALKIRRARK